MGESWLLPILLSKTSRVTGGFVEPGRRRFYQVQWALVVGTAFNAPLGSKCRKLCSQYSDACGRDRRLVSSDHPLATFRIDRLVGTVAQPGE
jgi:hypothetical protein